MSGHYVIRFRDWSAASLNRLCRAGFRHPSITRLLLALVIGGGTASFVSAQETVIPNGAQWRWRKGTNEVSSPNSLWRGPGFNDAGWSLGNAPFHYGESLAGGTLLSDMRSNYTCVFLRVRFVITNVVEVTSLRFAANYDDGFIAWINGTLVARTNVASTSPVYTNVASASHEAGSADSITIANLTGSYLVVGTNVLAVQAFNQSLTTSTDFRFETRLEITKTNANPPAITTVAPAPGSTQGALTEITVTFSEPVSGVAAEHFLINDQPANAVVGNAGTNRYTFVFTQPLPGLVGIGWNESTAVTDLAGGAFDTGATNATWSYTLVDGAAPQVSERTPVWGAIVGQLAQTEVFFNEPIVGMNASDLLINSQPAADVTGAEAGPYVFSFIQPAVGTVNFSWAGGHGITDNAANAFAGGNWSVTLNPGLAPGDVIINEFMVGNLSGITDEDGERPDWIEIRNRGTNAVNLLGWSLTDDADVPGKWTFPTRMLNPGEYLIVFASGKDRRAPVGGLRFHTNFKLDLFGDYLALFNAESPRVAVSEFAPAYPEQRNNYSYGRDATNGLRYFQASTPGTANGSSTIVAIAPEPHFSVGRGFFDAPFNLLLTTSLPGATIRYTADGSEPTAVNGQLYSRPIPITNTAFIRAIVLAVNHLPSRTRTHSYIYLDSVLTQPDNPPGFPSTWGTGANFPGNIIPAYYLMDQDPLRVNPDDSGSPIDPEKLQRLKNGLRQLPVVSLVLHRDDMFGVNGLYPRSTSGNKSPNEKACSLEMLLPDGSTAFTAGGGIDLHGNASRDPFKSPKHGFKLNFKGEYGEATLEYEGLFPGSPARRFDDLVLRPDFGASWLHWSDVSTEGLGAFQRSRASRFRDAYVKNSFRDMGHPASHNRFFHLMINGLYWGVYDFTEQPFEQFAENYFTASTNGYDIYDQGGLKASGGGTSSAYNTMLGIANLSDNANYEAMKQALDVTEFMDYMLCHFFVGAQDWGNNKNWFAIRPRVAGPDGRFRYLPWDGENTMLNENINRVPNGGGGTDVPSGLFTMLDDNAQFRLDFADRVHQHMIAPQGALTVAAASSRWQSWQTQLDNAIVAESSRWGDYRHDVHQYQNGEFVVYTRENQWVAEHDRILNSYLPNRHGIVLNQFRSAGLYPALEAPEYRENTVAGSIIGSGAVAAGYVVALLNPGSGTIYYTTNGSDPRVYYSGEVAAFALAYSAPVTLNASVTLKARVRNGTTWSALNEATFTVGDPGVPLRITEIMYNPVGGDAYEFIEIQNVGALPLDIGGFSLQGVTFIVPDNTILAPGAVLLLANNANPSLFATRYPSAMVFGYYAGNLANGGERVAILDGNLQTVIAVHYDDEDGWPASPDGGGFSLEIIDPRGDPNAPANWRASNAANGTPGLPPAAPAFKDMVLNEVMADNIGSVTNDGVFPDWVELHNRSGNVTNLAGWSLTDDSNARKFVLPGGTSIPAGGFLVIWCDTATNSPGLHAGFALGRSGETVSLFDASTNRVDALTFGLQLINYSVGRVGEDWQLTAPTPNAANVAAALASPTNLALNEWLADPAVGGQDWLELFNRSSNAPVALLGLHIGTSNALFRLGALSFLAPRGFVQLFAEELPGADQLEFKLPAAGGAIVLSSGTGTEIERVTYGPQTAGVSQGRLPDGNASITTFAGSVSPGANNYLLTWTGPALNEVLARNDRAAIAPWGGYADFVELFNPGGSVSNLAGMALGNSTDPGDAWTIPSGVAIPASGYLLIWCDPSRAASTNAGGALNTGFSLSGEGGNVVLFNTAGQPVNGVSYGFQVEDQTIGGVGGAWRLLATPTPGAANSAAASLGSVNSLRFNEWMTAPLVGDDWFELYNTDPLPVELSGLFLSDSPAVTSVTNSPIAPLSFIGGKRWALFHADGNPENGGDHANFSLDLLGETLRLYDTNLALIEVVDFGLQTTGVSQGRLPDGAADLVSFATTPTPGDANYLPLPGIVINEILTHTDPPLEDAVELFNATGGDLNIGGWYLSDSQSDLKRYRIPDGTILPAGGFKVFYQNQFGPGDGETDTPPLFTFNSAHGDAVHLSQADAAGNLSGYRVGVTFAAATNGVSFGRYATSVGVDFVALSQRTFGVDNPASVTQFRTGTGTNNAYPLIGPVVINQIMYHPPAFGTNTPAVVEFIELLNLTGSPVALFDPAHATNGWRLANAVSFDFPVNTTIPANGRLVVVSFDPLTDAAALAAFQSRYGAGSTLVGPYSGQLNNAGESIELWRPDAPQSPPRPDAGFVPQLLVERVTYSDLAPWPTNADGGGHSLQRIVAANYGNDPVNWKAALPSLGNPEVVPPSGSATLPGGGIVRLTFTVQTGRTYQVQYKTNLNDPVWLPLGSPIPATDPALIKDDNLTGQTSRFYRLMLLP